MHLEAEHIFRYLARRFPVCMASDEFHFFPQARFEPRDWAVWDDFSDAGILEVSRQIDQWIDAAGKAESPASDFDEIADAVMLFQMMQTLREQLCEVAPHRYQPTFHLTILAMGLVEAVDAGLDAVTERFKALPDFIDQAAIHLRRVPRVFRDLGIHMLDQITGWVRGLPVDPARRPPAMKALKGLAIHLRQVPVTDDFSPGPEFYDRIASTHMGCGMPLNAVAAELDREINETRQQLAYWAEKISPGTSWQVAISSLPVPDSPSGGLTALYREVVSELGRHSIDAGFMAEGDLKACPVTVAPVPGYMRPVRNSAAYSMPPGNPPTGGTFYIAPQDKDSDVFADYRLMTAHETFPGHHLLDMNRWRHRRAVRRHIEFPLFYEGWACIAEELFFDTGFFTSETDRMLLAKRRFWRAVRGRADFDIHTRRKSPEEAAERIARHGMAYPAALAMVHRYMLKPGYQLSYAIGRRRFRRIYDKYREHQPDPGAFARKVLSSGQVFFEDLEKILYR